MIIFRLRYLTGLFTDHCKKSFVYIPQEGNINIMKIICSKECLMKSLAISMRAVPVHTTMTILECILIDASANQIRFISNDMELGIETVVDGTIKEKGIAALEAKIFSEIIRKLPDSEVTIYVNDAYSCLITCERSRFQVPAFSADDYTRPPVIEKKNMLTLSQFTLREMIRQTIFFFSSNENNKIMT